MSFPTHKSMAVPLCDVKTSHNGVFTKSLKGALHGMVSIMFEHVIIIGSNVPVASTADKAPGASQLEFTIPGYLEYRNLFNDGTYCGIVKVFTERKIIEEHLEFKIRVSEIDNAWWITETLTPQKFTESYLIADSLDGDSLLFHPPENAFFFLNRGKLLVQSAGNSLLSALTVFVEGAYNHAFNVPFFLPNDLEISSYQADPENTSYSELVNAVDLLNFHSKSDIHDYEAYFFIEELSGLLHIYDTGEEILILLFGVAQANPSIVEHLEKLFVDLGLE